MKQFFPALFLGLLPAAATATEGWRHSPDDHAGKAVVTSPGGTEFMVDCGNSGEVGLVIAPDIRPVAVRGESRAAYTLVIDGRQRFELPMTCRNGRCSTGGAPGFLAAVLALKAGRWAELWDAHRGLDAVTLAGSSRAIDEMKRRGCPGF